MYQRRPRRFRRRPNGRHHLSHDNGGSQQRFRTNSFSNGQSRNNFGSTFSAEKLLEKYSVLAKEAMSSGDKTLSENYLQHAEHFMRIIEDKNKNRNENKVILETKSVEDDKKTKSVEDDRSSNENKDTDREQSLKNKV